LCISLYTAGGRKEGRFHRKKKKGRGKWILLEREKPKKGHDHLSEIITRKTRKYATQGREGMKNILYSKSSGGKKKEKKRKDLSSAGQKKQNQQKKRPSFSPLALARRR